MQSLLVFLLCVTLAHSLSWDIVVARSKRLEFYKDGTLTYSVTPASHRIKWIAYDPVHDRVLFADKYNSKDSASSFDIATNKTQSLIKKKTNRYIQNFAYDPATELLFGTVTNSIYSFSLKPEADNLFGDIVINLEEEKPRDIAVDSCKGYIYWTTMTYEIERARFNGTDREVVIESNTTTIRGGLTIDQQTKKIYWIDSQEYNDGGFSIESADLNGKNRITQYTESETDSTPEQLTVSKDFISWGDRMETFYWQLPKNTTSKTNVKPRRNSLTTQFSHGSEDIASNYNVEEQTDGIKDCNALQSLLPNRSGDCEKWFCVHGTKLSGESRCNCTQGYTGERCDVSVCQNYCFHGDCSASADGQPQCSCNAGYTGERCEVNPCHEYCLNDGVCTLNEDDGRVCQCTGPFEGERCDVPDFLIKCFNTISMFKDILNADLTSIGLDIGVNSTCASTVA